MRRHLTALIVLLGLVLMAVMPATSLALTPEEERNLAPRLLATGVPAVTTQQRVWVNPTSADLPIGGACMEMRIANENGVWGEWNQCKKTAHLLSAGYGIKGIFLQARSYKGGPLSNIFFQKVHYVAPAAYKGWAEVGPLTARPAWLWTTSGWKAMSLPASARVYAWPFSGGWHWGWHNEQWYAIKTQDLVLP